MLFYSCFYYFQILIRFVLLRYAPRSAASVVEDDSSHITMSTETVISEKRPRMADDDIMSKATDDIVDAADGAITDALSMMVDTALQNAPANANANMPGALLVVIMIWCISHYILHITSYLQYTWRII